MHSRSRDPLVAARPAIPAAALLAALALLPATGAHAAYFALDGSSVSFGDRVDEDLNPRGGRLRLGARLADRFDVELHAGRSREDEVAGLDRLEVGWVGAYLKAYLPVGSRSALYALGGLAGTRIERTLGEIELEDERAGFSFGAGLETELTERIDLSADWVRYLDREDASGEIDAVNLGLKWYF